MTYRAERAGLRHTYQDITKELKPVLSHIGLPERKTMSEGNPLHTGPIGEISFEIWLKAIDHADDDEPYFVNGSIYNESANSISTSKRSQNVIFREVSYGHVVVEIPSDYWQESDREGLEDMLNALAWINKHVFPSRASFAD
jgi:hypothetical protein